MIACRRMSTFLLSSFTTAQDTRSTIRVDRSAASGHGWTEVFLAAEHAACTQSADDSVAAGFSVVILHDLLSKDECETLTPSACPSRRCYVPILRHYVTRRFCVAWLGCEISFRSCSQPCLVARAASDVRLPLQSAAASLGMSALSLSLVSPHATSTSPGVISGHTRTNRLLPSSWHSRIELSLQAAGRPSGLKPIGHRQ
jgi:hypothetical protein